MAQADFTRISSNIAALNSLNSLRNINTKLGVSQLRLATGKRVNQASDDPAGLTIALKMNARNESLKVALSNIGDAKNMLAVAESGLQKISDILTEMRAKATAAATDTLGTDERTAIQSQLQSLAKQINDIVDQTQWNNTQMLDGTVNKWLQTGAGSGDATQWVLDTDHDAVQLQVASGSATGATLAAAATVAGSFATTGTRATGVESLTAFGGLSELGTGTYKFAIADKATGADTGKATDLNTTAGLASFQGIGGSSTNPYELASGRYTLTIDAVSATVNISYTIADSLGNVVATYDNLDISSSTTLMDTNGNNLGILIGGTAASFTAGQQIQFEYLAAGEVKMELYKITGTNEELMAVDANGSDDTGVDARRSYFYVDATATDPAYNTGVGFKVYLDPTWGNITINDSTEFNYTAAGDVSVDVSSYSLASAYMDKVDAAINTVSSSLNNIGSLVARLDSKEMTVGITQVNTEAAYNRIMNADMAYEQVEASKYMILQQTAIAMLAQSNMAPQGILSLFR